MTAFKVALFSGAAFLSTLNIVSSTEPAKADPAKAAVPAAPVAPSVAPAAPAQKDPNRVVAEIGGEKVTQATLEEMVKAILPKKFHETAFQNKDAYEKVIRRISELLALNAKAKKNKVDQDPEVQKKVKQAQELVVQKEFLKRELTPYVKEELVKAEFNKTQPQKVALRHIVVKTKEEAMKVIEEAKKGTPFNDLVKKYSIDETTKNEENPGFLGETNTFEIQEVNEDLAKGVASTAPAAVLANPLELNENGWSVIRVDSKSPLSFDDAKQFIVAKLTAEGTKKVVDATMKELNVKLFDMDGKPMSLEEKPAGASTAPAAPASK